MRACGWCTEANPYYRPETPPRKTGNPDDRVVIDLSDSPDAQMTSRNFRLDLQKAREHRTGQPKTTRPLAPDAGSSAHGFRNKTRTKSEMAGEITMKVIPQFGKRTDSDRLDYEDWSPGGEYSSSKSGNILILE